MHEPLIVVHRRLIRERLVLMAIWLVGWVVAGLYSSHGYLATAILLVSGPGVWLLQYAWKWWQRPDPRAAISRPVRGELDAGEDR